MKTIEVFQHIITCFSCEDKLYYDNEAINLGVKIIFDMPEVKDRDRGQEWDSQFGYGETTELKPNLGPVNLVGSEKLTKWILSKGKEVLGKDVKITKSWMNMMEYNSQGRCHNHLGYADGESNESPDLVAIFYPNNPTNGSDLVIIKDGQAGKLYTEFKDTFHISPKPGDLILHSPDIWHAVSVHKSHEPRLCFVYHIKKL